jgi:pyruvate ferredoxin oxidoreductase beta subunit
MNNLTNEKKIFKEIPEEWIAPGNAGCPGCGAVLAVRLAMKVLGKNTWAVMTTGCMAVNYTAPGTGTARSPWIHPLFGNAPAIASGLAVALKQRKLERDINLLVVGGDGATADIAFQVLSSAIQRQHKFIYICLDNQGYMNTGGQSSGTTELHSVTKSTPKGSTTIPKNLPEIFLKHSIHYLATANIGYPTDFIQKVQRAQQIAGPSYIHVSTPCVPAHGIESAQMLAIARKAVTTGYEILYEFDGKKVVLSKQSSPYTDQNARDPLEEYLSLQKRYQELVNNPNALNKLKEQVNEHWNRILKKISD